MTDNRFQHVESAVLGFPRIGLGRQLKKSTEDYWKGRLSEEDLRSAGRVIRQTHWRLQKNAGIDHIPSNDFSFYDQMLDMTALVGAIPARFRTKEKAFDLDTYFTMARGVQEKEGISRDAVPAMEMTKWFDTNYHYLVPEFEKKQAFRLLSEKPFLEFEEAKKLGILTRPVLIGPVTYLLLGKPQGNFPVLRLLESLLPVYVEILRRLKALGAASVQMDEPALVTDLAPEARRAFQRAYKFFTGEISGLPLMLTPYFGALGSNLKLAASLPVAGLHLDLSRAPQELKAASRSLPSDMMLSLGVVDGRNIWKNDLRKSLDLIKPVIKKRTGRCLVAGSCSFLHTPLDLKLEKNLESEQRLWFSFSLQKIQEIHLIQSAINLGETVVSEELKQNRQNILSRTKSSRIHRKSVQKRTMGIRSSDLKRRSRFEVRKLIQKKALNLPSFPTTTIGSFPQTQEVRKARADFKKGLWSESSYKTFLKERIREAVRIQEEIGLDVLVHGEPERNDMVEYFGEKLDGFAFTEEGWVQSYGTRYVKPPVIYGDVSRPAAMTLDWIKYAQSLTDKPMKGMLTGPITILQWSFVRDDQPRSTTARQIALAVRDEVLDLEKNGICVIQIDEPALREGLPLRKKDRKAYLRWAVDAFRLTANGVRNETQIHTHMCYGEFNDILPDIARMDADVISLETSRSQMELLKGFAKFRCPNEIGPGVYDIHSPRVPRTDEMEKLLRKASRFLPREHLWVNPDCGLKTRGWEETKLSLKAMVETARRLR